MTKEEREVVDAEIRTAVQWLEVETKKIRRRLAIEQGANRRMNNGFAPYKATHEEFARRMYAIGEKYGLLNAEQREEYERLKAEQ